MSVDGDSGSLTDNDVLWLMHFNPPSQHPVIVVKLLSPWIKGTAKSICIEKATYTRAVKNFRSCPTLELNCYCLVPTKNK